MKKAALVIAAVATALSGSACANYSEKADEALAFIEKTFLIADQGLYRARSGAEAKDKADADLLAVAAQVSALVSASSYNQPKYLPQVKKLAGAVEKYWNAEGDPPGFDSLPGVKTGDRSYESNAWMACALLSAHEITRDRKLLARAEGALDFALSGWNLQSDGGLYRSEASRKAKYASTNAIALLAALRLSAVPGKQEKYQPWVGKIRAWLDSKLLDKDGLYFGSINDDGTVGTAKRAGDAGLRIEAELAAYRATSDKKHLQAALKMADAAEKRFTSVGTGGLEDDGGMSVWLCGALIELSMTAKDTRYLRVAQRTADVVYRLARDPRDGGYRASWTFQPADKDQPKVLLANALPAVLFASLATYPDKEEFYAAGVRAASAGDFAIAAKRFSDAVGIDDSYVEAHYRLYRCYEKLRRTAEAKAEMDRLREFYKAGGELRERLRAVAAPSVYQGIEAQ